MKTKHLFYAAGLAAMMAACANEDIVLDAPQLPVDGTRATVENVKLNFTNGVESRLTFGANGYAWEATDSIGALLMDAPVASKSVKADGWLEAYQLVNYVNTSYPFTYDSAEGTWGCIGKMLEGNYFFAFPWSSYDGGRSVNHTLFNQQQTGVAGKAVAQSYADNQFFIGYAQIKAGTQANETLDDVIMTDVLGAMQFQLINNTGKTLHIYKAVLKNVPGAVTFKPVQDETFDIMRYVENEDYTETDTRDDALRQVAVATDDNAGAQLFVNGTDAERAIADGGKGYLLIMSAPLEATDLDGASLVIYTDEGMITIESLTEDINGETIEKVAPGVSTTIEIAIEEDDLNAIGSMDVYSEKDLIKLIESNIKANSSTELGATLHTDITLTKKVFDLLKSNSNLKLEITSAQESSKYLYNVTLADNLPNNVLEYNKLEIAAAEVIVEGTIDLGEKTSANAENLTIAEGAILNIKKEVDNEDIALPNITNKGTINVSAVKIANCSADITNEGTINLAANSEIQNAITNKEEGIVNVGGYAAAISNESEDGVINLGEGATLNSLTSNAGEVNAAASSQIKGGANSGLIVCADNTVKVTLSTVGNVAIAVPATVTEITEKLYEGSGYNTLILNSKVTVKHADMGGISSMILNEGAELVANNGVALNLTGTLTVKGAAKVTSTVTGAAANLSSVTVANMVVEKGATLTNNANVTVTTSWKNEGVVENNQTIKVENAIKTALDGKYGKVNKRPIEVYTAVDYGTAEKEVIELTSGTLTDVETKKTNAVDGNDTYEGLKIKGVTLDMSVDANKNKTSMLSTPNYVEFYGNIKNLTPSMAVAMNKLIINGGAVISGTNKTPILKVDELVVEAGATLTIEGGYLELDVTAQEKFGCEYITIEDGAYVNGEIVAKNADGAYLYWNVENSEWQVNQAYNSATIWASSAEELMNAMYSNNCQEVFISQSFEVSSSINVSGSRPLVIRGNGNTITLKSEGQSEGLYIFKVDEGSALEIDDLKLEGASTLVRSDDGEVTLKDVDVKVTDEVSTGVYCNGGELNIIGGTYVGTEDSNGYVVGVLNGCNAVITNAVVGNKDVNKGGLTVQKSEATLNGCELNVGVATAQAGLHVVKSRVDYINSKYNSCYVQIYSEVGEKAKVGSSEINGAMFDGTEEKAGSNFRGTQEETESKIEELKE